jgi:hypothetical protein
MGGSLFFVDKIPCFDSFDFLGFSNLEKGRRQDRNPDISEDLPEEGLNIIQPIKQSRNSYNRPRDHYFIPLFHFGIGSKSLIYFPVVFIFSHIAALLSRA